MNLKRLVASVAVMISALIIRIRSRRKVTYPEASTLVLAHPDLMADGRLVQLDAPANMRDLGGLKTAAGRTVKRGVIYRSGRLSGLTDADKIILTSLGIKLVCDIRSVQEAADEPDVLPPEIAYHSLPISDDTPTLARLRTLILGRPSLTEQVQTLYTDLLIDKNAHIFGETLNLLAQEEKQPALFHCTAGKDRTGIIAALLLLILGVPEDLVLAEYSLSNEFHDEFRNIAAPHIKRLGVFNVTVDDLFPLITADPQILQHALAHIREKYGSVEGYLTGPAGMDMQTLQKLRETLLEP